MVVWVVLAVIGAILAMGATVWYFLKRASSAETTSATLEVAGEQKQERIDALESQALRTEARKRQEETSVRKDIVERADTARARRLLRDAFSKNRSH